MSGPKKTLTKPQAMAVMTLGGIMFILAIFIPVEPGSIAQTVKFIVGFVGFCVLAVGSYFRPMKPNVEAAK